MADAGRSRVAFENTRLALVTPDAYSLSLDNDHWQFTLPRSPKMAWGGGKPVVYAGRDHQTDHGVHSFHFVLHSGDHLEPRFLHTTARRQAQPPIVFDRHEGLDGSPGATALHRSCGPGQRARYGRGADAAP